MEPHGVITSGAHHIILYLYITQNNLGDIITHQQCVINLLPRTVTHFRHNDGLMIAKTNNLFGTHGF